MCSVLPILLISTLFIVCLMFLTNKKEGYSSLGSDVDNYYQWHPYSHNLYNKKKMSSFPYNYHPYEHNQRFNCYGSNDINY